MAPASRPRSPRRRASKYGALLGQGGAVGGGEKLLDFPLPGEPDGGDGAEGRRPALPGELLHEQGALRDGVIVDPLVFPEVGEPRLVEVAEVALGQDARRDLDPVAGPQPDRRGICVRMQDRDAEVAPGFGVPVQKGDSFHAKVEIGLPDREPRRPEKAPGEVRVVGEREQLDRVFLVIAVFPRIQSGPDKQRREQDGGEGGPVLSRQVGRPARRQAGGDPAGDESRGEGQKRSQQDARRERH